VAAEFGVLDLHAGVLAFSDCVRLIEDFAEVLFSCDRGWSAPCHLLDVAHYFKQLFQLYVDVGKLSHYLLVLRL
jgi:hypothetical protein